MRQCGGFTFDLYPRADANRVDKRTSDLLPRLAIAIQQWSANDLAELFHGGGRDACRSAIQLLPQGIRGRIETVYLGPPFPEPRGDVGIARRDHTGLDGVMKIGQATSSLG